VGSAYLRIARDQPGFAADFLATFNPASMPYLMEHIQQHLGGLAGDTSEFEFGLELLLARAREG
jgi:hypothetical protein